MTTSFTAFASNDFGAGDLRAEKTLVLGLNLLSNEIVEDRQNRITAVRDSPVAMIILMETIIY